MFGVSGGELIILLLIGLIVLGPERLPRVANQIGGWLGQARRMTRVMKRQLEEELDLNQTLNINPPSPASRQPSFKKDTQQQPQTDADGETALPDYPLPRDDDDYSPAHGSDESGTGVGDEPHDEGGDTTAASIDATTASAEAADTDHAGKKTADTEVES